MNNQTKLPFSDFTQHHRDVYLRLKLRALDRKLQLPSAYRPAEVKPFLPQVIVGEK
jgi:hypothetical protein